MVRTKRSTELARLSQLAISARIPAVVAMLALVLLCLVRSQRLMTARSKPPLSGTAHLVEATSNQTTALLTSTPASKKNSPRSKKKHMSLTGILKINETAQSIESTWPIKKAIAHMNKHD